MRTPRTLQQAILDGLVRATKEVGALKSVHLDNSAKIQFEQLKIIESHVLDYLRQRFGEAYLLSDHHSLELTLLRQLARQIGVEAESHEVLFNNPSGAV